MNNIFSTNTQADSQLRVAQRATQRPDSDLASRRAQKRDVLGARSSSDAVLKAIADARALDRDLSRARDAAAANSSASNDARDAAVQRGDHRRGATSSDRAKDALVSGQDARKRIEGRDKDTQVNDDYHAEVIDDKPELGSGALAQSEEGALEFVNTLGLSGSEAGLLNAYLGKNSEKSVENAAIKSSTTAGKVSAAYESITANLDTEEVVLLNKMAQGELPSLVNAKAGAYEHAQSAGNENYGTHGTGEEGALAKDTAKGVVADLGITRDKAALEKALLNIEGVHQENMGKTIDGKAGIEAALIASADCEGKSPLDMALLGEDISEMKIAGVVAEGVSDAGDSSKKTGVGKEGTLSEATSTKTLKEAYVEAHTEEKGTDDEDDGSEVQKTTQSQSASAKKVAGQKAIVQPPLQTHASLDELVFDLEQAVDSAELVEAVAGEKDSGFGSGAGRGSKGEGHQQDMAAMKNDGKAEGAMQTKEASSGVEAAKKTSAATKTFGSEKLREGVFNAVDRGVRLSLANGGQTAKLTIRPESLGELRIKLSIGEDGLVQTKIMVDNSAVKSMLDADSNRLKEIFNEQGLTLDSYSVEVSNGWSGKSAKGQRDNLNFGARKYYTDAPSEDVEMEPSMIAGNGYGASSGVSLDLFA